MFNRRQVATDTTSEPTASKPQRFSRPTNDEIDARLIQLVDTAGNIEAPILKTYAMRSFQKSTHVLVELDPGGPGRHTVCKIMPLKELRDQERLKERTVRQAKHAAKTSTKQIEMNWSIDSHDLAHRLKKLSSFIEKGRIVEIVLTRKKGKRIATPPEIQQLLDQINVAVEGANARQSKAVEGEPGKTLTMTIERKE